MTTVRVLSLNVFLRPPGIQEAQGDYKDVRVRYLMRKIIQYDIVLLQEMFVAGSNRTAQVISYAKKHGLSYHAGSVYPSLWSKQLVDGGLLILSRYEICKFAVHRFSSGCGSDALASKGIVYAQVQLSPTNPQAKLNVFTTHTQAGNRREATTIRWQQLHEISRFVLQHSELNVPSLLGGDFNLDARHSFDFPVDSDIPLSIACTESKEYTEFLRFFGDSMKIVDMLPSHGVTNGNGHGKLKHTWTNEVVDKEGKCIDYLFHLHHKKSPPGIQIVQSSVDPCALEDIDPTSPVPAHVTHLSDHWGISAIIKIPYPNAQQGNSIGAPPIEFKHSYLWMIKPAGVLFGAGVNAMEIPESITSLHHEHPLYPANLSSLVGEHQAYAGGAGCNVCSNSCGGSWHCSLCLFDLCGECSGVNIPSKTIRHPSHQHELTFYNLAELRSDHSYISIQCDKCSSGAYCSYHCAECSYDLCLPCALCEIAPFFSSDPNAVGEEPEEHEEQDDSEGLMNISMGKTAIASSIENDDHRAKFAVDGNMNTRFASDSHDPQWLEVDLGPLHSISHVCIQWEAAYASRYDIQLSSDRVHWMTAASVVNNREGWVKTMLPENSSGNFIRMFGHERGTTWGYSMFHFNVYGTPLVTLKPGVFVTPSNVTLGARVVRGLDWSATSSFDGVYGYPGTVVAFKRPGEAPYCDSNESYLGPDSCCVVRWDLFTSRAIHRIGAQGKYELYFHPEHAPDNSTTDVPTSADLDTSQKDATSDELVGEVLTLESTLWQIPRSERVGWKERLSERPPHEIRPLDITQVERVIQGKLLAADVESKPKSISVFVSSTFTDTASERNLLIADVYPYLRRYAALLGLEFSASEMRWGIREEASNSHQTSTICMAELARCQRTSLNLNYILILGNKYGYRPFPNEIPVDEFNHLSEEMNNEDKILALQWFHCNSNTVPPMMSLQSSSFASPGTWWPIFEQLQRAFRSARHSLTNPKRQDLYNVSVTECEINNGLLSHSDPKAFVYHRILTDIDVKHSKAPMYVDVASGELDTDAQTLLETLRKEKVRPKQPASKDFTLPWGPEVLPETHPEYLVEFCDHFCSLLCDALLQASEEIHVQVDTLYSEVLHHAMFSFHRAAHFVGRVDVLNSVQTYLKSSSNLPFVLYGRGGAGKSAVMAKIALKMSGSAAAGPGHAAVAAQRQEAVLILRFLGTSLESTTLRKLLASICEQIQRNYDLPLNPLPQEIDNLVSYFHTLLQSATDEKPLTLLLDSLDQLSTADNAHHLTWLPKMLPNHCKLIVSTLDAADEGGSCLMKLRAQINPSQLLELPIMTQSDGNEIVTSWLEAHQWALTSDQMEFVLGSFAQCPLPLYLHVAFQLVLPWASYTPLEPTIFPSTIPDLLRHLFAKLCSMHGKILVYHAGGYLTLARRGISRSELEDLLSLDDTVLNDVYQWWVPPIRRIPSLLVTRFLSDLESYLVTHAADGGVPVLSWYHREFKVAATEIFLQETSTSMELSQILAEYFSNEYANEAKTFTDKKGVRGRAQRKVTPQPLKIGKEINQRHISELPSALIGAKNWMQVENVLSSAEFLQASVHVGVIHESLSDIRRAIKLMLADDTPPCILPEIAVFLSRNMYTLQRRPQSFYQCVMNQPKASQLRQSAIKTLQPPLTKGYFQSVSTETDPSSLITTFMAGPAGDQGCVVLAFSPDSLKVAGITVNDSYSTSHLSVFDFSTNTIQWTIGVVDGKFKALAWTIDGETVVVATNNDELHFYSVRIGVRQKILKQTGKQHVITSVVCVDATTLVTADRKHKEIAIWCLSTGQVKTTLAIKGHGEDDHNDRQKMTQLVLTPDRKFLGVASYSGDLSVWNCATWTQETSYKAKEVKYASLSSDGTMFAVNHDTHDGEGAAIYSKRFDHPKLLTMEALDMTGSALATCGLVFHPNHSSILYILNSTTQIYAFDVVSERRLAIYAAPGHSFGGNISMSCDGTLIGTIGQTNNILLWNPAAQPSKLGAAGEVEGITLHPTEDLVAVGASCSESMRMVSIYNPMDIKYEFVNTQSYSTACTRVVFSQDGRRMAATTNTNSVCFAEMQDDNEIVTNFYDIFKEEAIDVTIHPNGQYVATVGIDERHKKNGHLRYVHWNGIVKWEVDKMHYQACRMGGKLLEMAPQGESLACEHSDHQLVVLRTDTGEVAYSFPKSGGERAYRFSHDFTHVVMSSKESEIQVWIKDQKTPKICYKPHAEITNVTGVGISLECGVVFSCAEDGLLVAANLDDGSLVDIYYNPELQSINGFDCQTLNRSSPRLAFGDAIGRVTVFDWIPSCTS